MSRPLKAMYFALVIPLLFGCGDKATQSATAANKPKLVRSLVVGNAAEESNRRFSGDVRARYESTLGFRIPGKITERLVDVGSRVKSGQSLARLDPSDARLAATQAAANSQLAAAELKRTQELKAKNFVSQAALDAKLTAAQASAAAAQLASNQTTYTSLLADAHGIITAVLAEHGQVVAAGQGVVRLARDGEREIAIAVPEAALAGIKLGGPANIRLWAANQSFDGKIREIAPAADPATRTFPTRVTILGAPADLALGLSATVSFGGAAGEKFRVPLAAIIQNGTQPAVWVIQEDAGAYKVALRPIDVERYGDQGAVVRNGLAAGERIVAAGAFMLIAGETVRLAEESRP